MEFSYKHLSITSPTPSASLCAVPHCWALSFGAEPGGPQRGGRQGTRAPSTSKAAGGQRLHAPQSPAELSSLAGITVKSFIVRRERNGGAAHEIVRDVWKRRGREREGRGKERDS